MPRRLSDLKYYLYISNTKLNMLYQQIEATGKSKRAIEWKANVAFASASVKKETEKAPHQEERLRRVTEEIEASGQVGTVDEPNLYVKGTLPMRWRFYKDAGRPEGEPPLVYFGGRTDQTYLDLVAQLVM